VAGFARRLAGLLAAGCHNAASLVSGAGTGSDSGGDSAAKLPPPDANCPADAMGGGVCPLNFCGQVDSVAALAPGYTCDIPSAGTGPAAAPICLGGGLN
jgi:hypothetical protein